MKEPLPNNNCGDCSGWLAYHEEGVDDEKILNYCKTKCEFYKRYNKGSIEDDN